MCKTILWSLYGALYGERSTAHVKKKMKEKKTCLG